MNTTQTRQCPTNIEFRPLVIPTVRITAEKHIETRDSYPGRSAQRHRLTPSKAAGKRTSANRSPFACRLDASPVASPFADHRWESRAGRLREKQNERCVGAMPSKSCAPRVGRFLFSLPVHNTGSWNWQGTAAGRDCREPAY